MPGTEKVEEAGSGSDSDDDKKSKHRDKSRGGKKKPLSEYEKKRQKIEECKTSLPVFPFREQLLQAIEEHQVQIHVILESISSTSMRAFYSYACEKAAGFSKNNFTKLFRTKFPCASRHLQCASRQLVYAKKSFEFFSPKFCRGLLALKWIKNYISTSFFKYSPTLLRYNKLCYYEPPF